jgi:plasmid stability protein
MAQIIVRHLEETVKAALKERAARHACSMEEEVRQILRAAVSADAPVSVRLGSRIAARFAAVGLSEPIPELQGQTVEPMHFDT